jgi:hypothetical protein
MKNLGALVGVVVLGLLAGCGPVGPEELEREAVVPEELANIAADGEAMAEALPTCKLGLLCDRSRYPNVLASTPYQPCVPQFSVCLATTEPACMRLECDPLGCHSTFGTRQATSSRQRTTVYYNGEGETCSQYETEATAWACC